MRSAFLFLILSLVALPNQAEPCWEVDRVIQEALAKEAYYWDDYDAIFNKPTPLKYKTPPKFRGVRTYASPLPEYVPYLSLGLFWRHEERMGEISDLDVLSRQLTMNLKHKVITYEQFFDEGLVKMDEGREITQDVEAAIRTVMRHAPDSKVILFDLSGIDLQRAFDPSYSPKVPDQLKRYTNEEISLITRNKKYFRATIWHKDGKVLTEEEVKALFSPYRPELFSSP